LRRPRRGTIVLVVFERFSTDARQALILGGEETRTLSDGRIGTEHILLGLLRQENTVAADVLTTLGVTLDAVRVEIVRLARPDEEPSESLEELGHTPFTPRAKAVLELSLREALSLGSNSIETEHVLLGLVRKSDGLASRILADMGVDTQRVRSETLARRPEAAARRRRRAELRRTRSELRFPWATTPTRWEYRIERPAAPDWLSVETLNALGEEGWELVGAAPAELGGGLVFKRPIATARTRLEPQDPEAA
jgi:ATP-dependent Clp protease ATP-binding subunit ClpA